MVLSIILTVLHVLVCLFLVVVVLLQQGKSADIASTFGGMGSQTVFGPRGSATVLSRATTIAAALFMVTSLSLSILSTRQGGGNSNSILEKTPDAAQQKQAPPVNGGKPTVTLFNEKGEKVGEQEIKLPPNPNAPKTDQQQKK